MALNKKNNLILTLVVFAALAGVIWWIAIGPKQEASPQRALRTVTGQATNSPFQSRHVSQIVVHPQNPNIVFAAVAAQGIFKSDDRGTSWEPLIQGIRDLMIFQLVLDSSSPDTLYIGTLGGGIYKSRDAGKTWTGSNKGLTNTSIEGLLIHPTRPNVLYAVTTDGGVFRSDDHGGLWTLFNQGLPEWEHNNVQSFLAVLPSRPDTIYLANYKGIFARSEGALAWKGAAAGLEKEEISYFFPESRQDTFLAVTKSGKLYRSRDYAETWTMITDKLKDFGFYAVAADPNDPSVLYAAVGSHGVLKSVDQGANWEKLDLEIHQLNVRSLAMDPSDPRSIYIGTQNSGLWISGDGGETWRETIGIANLDWADLMEFIQPSGPDPSAVPSGEITDPVPAEFKKCNACHGWSDPNLNKHLHTFWFVAPTPRDWTHTVERMSSRSQLTPEETRTITEYLNQHYGLSSAVAPEKPT